MAISWLDIKLALWLKLGLSRSFKNQIIEVNDVVGIDHLSNKPITRIP